MRINRIELLAQLDALAPGLSPQEMIEQSSCFAFRGGYAMTFNDEIACRSRTALEIEGAVTAAPLLGLLRKLPDDEIDASTRGGELLISGKGRRDAGIRMETEVTLPVDAVERPAAWGPLPPEFVEAVSTVSQCAGKDESKFYLTCVHITPRYVEACDNLQATQFRFATGFAADALVRRDSIRHIATHGATEFAETETWLHFRNPNRVVLSLRRFVEDYPSLREILKVDGKPTELPRGIAEAAERADVFASENADAEAVTISMRPGRLELRAESSQGWYSERKSVKYAGPPLSFTIAPKILADLVKRHNQCVITPERLLVDGGKFRYVTCLGIAQNDKQKETRRKKDGNEESGKD